MGRTKAINDVINIQSQDGNWNCDSYMHGLLNGLILAEAIYDNKDAEFYDAPDEWLCISQETKLRQKYPALREAYEHYKTIEKLVK